MHDNQIDSEVAKCLQHCRKSGAATVCVAEYVLRLRDDHAWDPAQADEVGRRALRALKLVDPPSEAGGGLA